LLECGVPAKDETIQQAAQAVRSAAPRLTHTYTISVAILFLDRLGDKRDDALIRSLALRLVAGQQGTGDWSYDCPLLSDNDAKALDNFLTSRLGGSDKWPVDPKSMPQSLAGIGVVRDPAAPLAKTSRLPDHSNSQFAILALWVAQRHGSPVAAALLLAARHFRETQHVEGSWAYRTISHPSLWRASMTCAGLLALAVGRSVGPLPADGMEPEPDPAIQKALLHMTLHIETVARIRSPQGGSIVYAESRGDLYFLWSLERVAVIYDLKTIAGKDWYAWASKAIVESQKDDGSWRDVFPGSVDTCFALLVLKRVNVAPDLTDVVKRVVSVKDLEAAADK
jgi:hypothetical protein